MHRDPALLAALQHETRSWQQQQAAKAAKAAAVGAVLIRQLWNSELGITAHKFSTTEEGVRQAKQLTMVDKLEDEGWADQVAPEELTEASHREPEWAVFESSGLFRL